jgi:hypothetical protein
LAKGNNRRAQRFCGVLTVKRQICAECNQSLF